MINNLCLWKRRQGDAALKTAVQGRRQCREKNCRKKSTRMRRVASRLSPGQLQFAAGPANQEDCRLCPLLLLSTLLRQALLLLLQLHAERSLQG